jgi:sortase A
VAWGAVCAVIWLVAWAIGKRWRRLKWPSYVVGVLPFLVALFFFFEEFSRLLPANF